MHIIYSHRIVISPIASTSHITIYWHVPNYWGAFIRTKICIGSSFVYAVRRYGKTDG
jgi:hypothetical protein